MNNCGIQILSLSLINESHFDGNYGLRLFIASKRMANWMNRVKIPFNTYIYIYSQQILARYCVM